MKQAKNMRSYTNFVKKEFYFSLMCFLFFHIFVIISQSNNSDWFMNLAIFFLIILNLAMVVNPLIYKNYYDKDIKDGSLKVLIKSYIFTSVIFIIFTIASVLLIPFAFIFREADDLKLPSNLEFLGILLGAILLINFYFPMMHYLYTSYRAFRKIKKD